MKNKKILMKLLMISIVLVAFILINPIEVHAFDQNQTLIIKTQINNWDEDASLYLVKKENASGSVTINGQTVNYTKKVYLDDSEYFSSSDAEEITSYATTS